MYRYFALAQCVCLLCVLLLLFVVFFSPWAPLLLRLDAPCAFLIVQVLAVAAAVVRQRAGRADAVAAARGRRASTAHDTATVPPRRGCGVDRRNM